MSKGWSQTTVLFVEFVSGHESVLLKRDGFGVSVKIRSSESAFFMKIIRYLFFTGYSRESTHMKISQF